MYRAQTADLRATFAHMVEGERLAQTQAFGALGQETFDAILNEAGRLAEEAFAPANRAGDLEHARLENGVVRTPTGYREAYDAFAAGGWVGMTAPEAFGGMALPLTYQTAVNELAASANLSLSLCPLMTQGAIRALVAHGTPDQKARYLPPMISGRWTGAMNLTEPNAGSDVGALRCRAEPLGDGRYALTGGKIWISWGDNDFAENVVHLVLARLPDAPPGSAGVSLFATPKRLVDADGAVGAHNGLKVVSLDQKLGLHGSPTCVMAYDGAVGELIGAPHKGLACMFTMMNDARLGVGVQGVAVAEAATQKALAFAQERVQGRTPVGDGRGPIFDHADVRRMLSIMKAQTQAARAIAFDCALHLDLAHAADDPEARAAAEAMGAFLTPIAKAFGADTGNEVAHQGVQVHGGMGVIEETGAAQFSRDVRVTAIYEGTNGIQSMDLVGRKLSMDGGATARAFLERSAEAAAALAGVEGLQAVGAGLARAVTQARAATDWMLAAERVDRAAGATAYLRLIALIAGATHLGRGAAGSGEPARAALARVFAERLLPETAGLAERAMAGAATLYALSARDLAV